MLPDRLEAVLVAALAWRGVVAIEHALLERAELLQVLHALLGAARAEKSVAARTAELERDAEPRAVAILRPVRHALREVDDLAWPDPAVGTVVLPVAAEAHADLIEIVLVSRRHNLAALASQHQPEIVGRILVADQQRLELAVAAANGGTGFLALVRVSDPHGFVSCIF